MKLPKNKTLGWKNKSESPENSGDSAKVVPGELFSNSFLEDLDKIWALRSVIPDPKNPDYTKDK